MGKYIYLYNAKNIFQEFVFFGLIWTLDMHNNKEIIIFSIKACKFIMGKHDMKYQH